MSSLREAWAAWRALGAEHRHAALAAVGLALALFLPWYEKSAFVLQGGELVSARERLTAFEVVSYVEGAVMLVCVAVLALVYTRARRWPFHLPGGDGTVVAIGGVWATALLVWRLFDKPDVEGRAVTIGVEWGWFLSVVLAGALTLYGIRIRQAGYLEPPNPAAEPPRPDPSASEGHIAADRDDGDATTTMHSASGDSAGATPGRASTPAAEDARDETSPARPNTGETGAGSEAPARNRSDRSPPADEAPRDRAGEPTREASGGPPASRRVTQAIDEPRFPPPHSSA